MVRFLAFLFIATFCFGASLQENLKSIIGNKVYEVNIKKINSLFSNEASFIDNNSNLNYEKITNLLVTNSLLNLNYASPVYMDLTFRSKTSALLFLKVISQSLNDIGYTYFLTKEFSTVDSQILWNISINTQFLPNPGSLYKELKSENTFITNITRNNQFSFTYDIDMSHASIHTHYYEPDIDFELSKPLEPYFFNIIGKSSIQITSKSSDAWFAFVKIFDKNLKLLSQIKSDKKEKSININFSPDATYILIEDAYSLENIKHGLTIYIKSN